MRRKRLELGLYKVRYGKFDWHVRGKEVTSPEVDPERRVSLVVKADVDGSLEAILQCLDTYEGTEVREITTLFEECVSIR